MTRAEIQAFFPLISTTRAGKIDFGGLNYAVPTLDWLQNEFYPYFKKKLWNENADTWAVKWECRDFVRAYACLAQLANLEAKNTPDGDDILSVGEFWFHPGKNPIFEDHAIAPCITDKGLVFIDPQNNEVWPISPIEFQSCSYARF